MPSLKSRFNWTSRQPLQAYRFPFLHVRWFHVPIASVILTSFPRTAELAVYAVEFWLYHRLRLSATIVRPNNLSNSCLVFRFVTDRRKKETHRIDSQPSYQSNMCSLRRVSCTLNILHSELAFRIYMECNHMSCTRISSPVKIMSTHAHNAFL